MTPITFFFTTKIKENRLNKHYRNLNWSYLHLFLNGFDQQKSDKCYFAFYLSLYLTLPWLLTLMQKFASVPIIKQKKKGRNVLNYKQTTVSATLFVYHCVRYNTGTNYTLILFTFVSLVNFWRRLFLLERWQNKCYSPCGPRTIWLMSAWPLRRHSVTALWSSVWMVCHTRKHTHTHRHTVKIRLGIKRTRESVWACFGWVFVFSTWYFIK